MESGSVWKIGLKKEGLALGLLVLGASLLQLLVSVLERPARSLRVRRWFDCANHPKSISAVLLDALWCSHVAAVLQSLIGFVAFVLAVLTGQFAGIAGFLVAEVVILRYLPRRWRTRQAKIRFLNAHKVIIDKYIPSVDAKLSLPDDERDGGVLLCRVSELLGFKGLDDNHDGEEQETVSDLVSDVFSALTRADFNNVQNNSFSNCPQLNWTYRRAQTIVLKILRRRQSESSHVVGFLKVLELKTHEFSTRHPKKSLTREVLFRVENYHMKGSSAVKAILRSRINDHVKLMAHKLLELLLWPDSLIHHENWKSNILPCSSIIPKNCIANAALNETRHFLENILLLAHFGQLSSNVSGGFRAALEKSRVMTLPRWLNNVTRRFSDTDAAAKLIAIGVTLLNVPISSLQAFTVGDVLDMTSLLGHPWVGCIEYRAANVRPTILTSLEESASLQSQVVDRVGSHSIRVFGWELEYGGRAFFDDGEAPQLFREDPVCPEVQITLRYIARGLTMKLLTALKERELPLERALGDQGAVMHEVGDLGKEKVLGEMCERLIALGTCIRCFALTGKFQNDLDLSVLLSLVGAARHRKISSIGRESLTSLELTIEYLYMRTAAEFVWITLQQDEILRGRYNRSAEEQVISSRQEWISIVRLASFLSDEGKILADNFEKLILVLEQFVDRIVSVGNSTMTGPRIYQYSADPRFRCISDPLFITAIGNMLCAQYVLDSAHGHPFKSIGPFIVIFEWSLKIPLNSNPLFVGVFWLWFGITSEETRGVCESLGLTNLSDLIGNLASAIPPEWGRTPEKGPHQETLDPDLVQKFWRVAGHFRRSWINLHQVTFERQVCEFRRPAEYDRFAPVRHFSRSASESINSNKCVTGIILKKLRGGLTAPGAEMLCEVARILGAAAAAREQGSDLVSF